MFKEKKVLFFYVAVICVLYSQIVFFGKSLLPNLYYPKEFAPFGYEGRKPASSFNVDLATPTFYELPMNYLVGKMYLKGDLPLWNPYQGAGVALASQYSTRVFFPYQILENICPYWLWDYFMLGRLFVAGFFTYLFLRLLGLSLLPAFLGGIFYMFSGSFVWFINLEQFVNVAMLVPILLFSLERMIKFRKRRFIAESSIAFALLFLGGQPEITIYVLLLTACYYFFRIERKGLGYFIKENLKFFISLLLGLGLSCLVILPFLEYIPNSFNFHPLGGDMGIRDPMGLSYVFAIFMPTAYTYPTFWRTFPINGPWDCLGGYIGILPMFLMLLAFFHEMNRYRKYLLFFGIFGSLIILKNIGFPLISWIGRLPLLDMVWSQRWAGCVWTFCFACAGAFSIEVISSPLEPKRLRICLVAFLYLIFLIFLFSKLVYILALAGLSDPFLKRYISSALFLNKLKMIVIPFVPIFISMISTFFFLKNKRSFVLSLVALSTLEFWFYIPKGMDNFWEGLKVIPLIMGLLVVFAILREKKLLAIYGLILFLISGSIIDLKSSYGFPQRYNPFKKPPYIELLEEKEDNFRVMAIGGVLMPNYSSAFEIFDVRYIDSLSPLHYQHFIDRHLMRKSDFKISDQLWFTGEPLNNKDVEDNLLFYSYLGVKYIIAPPQTHIDLPLIHDREVKIYENPYCFPRIYVASKVKYATDYKEAQKFLGEDGFDLRNCVALEEKIPFWYIPNDESLGYQAKILGYSPNKVVVSCYLKSNGILVLTDTFFPGWKAYVDGKEEKIYRVNGLVRGVFLEKGKHSIVFKYFPFSFKLGLGISLLSILILMLIMALRRQ